MTDNEIHEALRNNNPFLSSASPLPWENHTPDLAQLNRSTSERITELILFKRRNPATPLAGLITGEAGMGKTHILTRILRNLRTNAKRAIFVTVKTFRDPEGALNHLLREVFISLRRLHSEGRTQFDMLMSEFAISYQEHRRNEGITRTDNTNIKRCLSRDIPGLDPNFLKAIMLYIGSNDKDTRADILDWLIEGLDDEDSNRLGLPSRDLYSASDAKKEQEAENILTSLGLILAYSKVSMVVCFDQLDSMRDRKLIEAWGNCVALLMNNLSGILPLFFVKAQIWNDVFVPVLDDAVVHRLRINMMTMKACTIDQAKQIIHDRIINAFKNNNSAEEIYTWLINRLQKKLLDEYSPREVIELANREIVDLPPDPDDDSQKPTSDEIIKSIRTAYDDEYSKVQSEEILWPPSAEQLTLTLGTWLEAHDGFQFSKSELKHIKITGYYNDNIFAFIIVTAKNHASASSGIKQGSNFLKINRGGYCCYITETRTHKKTWNQANGFLENFKALGGKVIMLDSNERTKWYALTSLINRIDNGDVNLCVKSVKSTATRKELKEFMKRVKLLDFPFADKNSEHEINLDPEVKPVLMTEIEFNDENLMSTLKELVKNSPMKILSTDKALDLLAQRDILVAREKFLEFVKLHKEVFRTFTSQNDEILITLSYTKTK